jgi:hypothetical protein
MNQFIDKCVLTFILAVALLLSLAACGGEAVPVTTSGTTPSASSSPTNSATTAPTLGTTQPNGDPAGQQTPETVFVEYPLREMGVFSEDRAWVKYGDQNQPSTALMDNTGKVLFSTDYEIRYSSPFEDGLSYCIVNGEPDYKWFVIDSAGTVLSSNFDVSSMDAVKTNNYILLGYADGHFLVAEHITGFDANEWRLGTIDKNGNIINELKPRPDFDIERTVGDLDYSLENGTLSRLFLYAGDGIVSMQYAGGFYSISEDKAVNLITEDGTPFHSGSQALHFYGDFYEGSTLVSYHVGGASKYFIMSSDYLSGDMNNTEIYKPLQAESVSGYNEGLYVGWVEPDNTTMIDYDYRPGGYGYFDIAGQLAISFPEYEGRKHYCAPFSGGYAAMSIAGVDDFWYVTVIDKTGKKMYEPIKTDDDVENTYSEHLVSGVSSHGYIYDSIGGERVIITPNGEILKPGIDDLSIIGKDASFGNISNGFILTNEGYTSLDGNTVISSVSIPETTPVVDEEIIPSSTYTGSFSLAGMWKSDNGTILTFNDNGTVGPVLFGFEGGPDGSWTISSQADTNGHYTLNASHLTGGNIIYKVRLLGKDEIEIYEESGDSYGSSYYHLVRQ